MLASMRPARLFTVLYFSATRRNQAHSLTGGYLGFKSTGFSLGMMMIQIQYLLWSNCKGDVSLWATRLLSIPGGILPYKRLLGMCHWMGSHFHDWIDFYGIAFSIELLEWGRTFSDFFRKGSSSYLWLANVPECLNCNNSGAPRARKARAWAEPHSLLNLPIPENLVIT